MPRTTQVFLRADRGRNHKLFLSRARACMEARGMVPAADECGCPYCTYWREFFAKARLAAKRKTAS